MTITTRETTSAGVTNKGAALTNAELDANFVDILAKVNLTSPTEKITPVDADVIGVSDSAAGNILKKVTLTNLKAFLKTYFDSLYAKVGAITGSGLTMGTGFLLGRATAATGAVEQITIGSGLSFTGTTLNAAVPPVLSVGGYTGAVGAAELLTAIKTVDGSGSGLDAGLLGGLSLSSFAVGTGTTAGNYYHNTPMAVATDGPGATWTKMLHARVFVTGTVRMRYGMNGLGINTYCRPYLNGVAVGTQRGPNVTGPVYFTDDITVTKGDIISLYMYGGAAGSTVSITGFGTGNLDGVPVTGGVAPAAETV